MVTDHNGYGLDYHYVGHHNFIFVLSQRFQFEKGHNSFFTLELIS